jgi:hypothetical protein
MMTSSNPAIASPNVHRQPNFANQTFFEKKSMTSIHTSTPGSEAVDWSEDEREMPAAMSASVQSIKSSAGNTTTQRRPSWLSEVQQSFADVSRCSSPLVGHVLTTPSATVLCPIKINEITMVEPPKVSHKNPNPNQVYAVEEGEG